VWISHKKEVLYRNDDLFGEADDEIDWPWEKSGTPSFLVAGMGID
jgi:hypothetical protein